MDRRIKKYIKTKQKLINLLEEQKQAIIHQAVTRGLDPNVPLKPSGVEWLGDVPGHWRVLPNRETLSIRSQIVGKFSSEHLLLSLTVNGVIARDLENPTGKFPLSFDSYQVVLPNDLIFCLFDIDETPRTIGFSELSGMITAAYTVCTCSSAETAKFLYYLYLDKDFHKSLKPYYSGLRKVIQKARFLSIKIALPTLKEITEIINYINIKVNEIESLKIYYLDQIKAIKEYNSCLVSDVVTGKLDVREVASRLPDELHDLSEVIEDISVEDIIDNGEELQEDVMEEE